MPHIPRCPDCGAPLPINSPASSCPACLMRLGLMVNLAAPESPSIRTPQPEVTYVPNTPRFGKLPTPDELAVLFPELEILQLLGHGGMGAVYQARQTGLDRIVALKIIMPEVAGEPGFAERFVREARVLARLNHPNIVTIHDFGQRQGLHYLLMEFVDGVNLRTMLQPGAMSPEHALRIISALCTALQYAHEEGIVHRDIKPENILVDSKGRVKLADFGLARLAGHNPDQLSLTGARQVVGTPRYMAPEQMSGSRAVDHRADLYSLGVVFYEMLTGEVPVGRFAPPSQHVVLDRRFDDVILRALENDPNQRYQSASEIQTAVESISHVAQFNRSATRSNPTLPLDASVSDRAVPTNSIFLSAPWSGLVWVQQVVRRVPRQLRWTTGMITLGTVLVIYWGLRTFWSGPGLIYAASSGSTIAVRFWLFCGADLHARDEAGMTPLLWASWNRKPDVVRQLLVSGADVNEKSNDGETALMKAAFQGQLNIVTQLLATPATVNETDEAGETALLVAASEGHVAITEALLRYGADARVSSRDGYTPLMAASLHGHTSIASLLLPHSQVNAADRRGETASIKAASRGHVALVQSLLDANANVNMADVNGATAATYAIAGGHTPVVDMLVSHGAGPHPLIDFYLGFRFARAGQFAEALPKLQQAAASSSLLSKGLVFSIDDWRYEIEAGGCFVWLILGECEQRLGHTVEAANAFQNAMEAARNNSNRFALYRRKFVHPQHTILERFELTPNEIELHKKDPTLPWHLFRHYTEEQNDGRNTRGQSGSAENEVRDLFK